MRPKLSRSLVTALYSILIVASIAAPARSAPSPAETFVTHNIQAGLTILNDKQLTAAQRNINFETLLLGITDLKRIARFTLGSYGASVSQAEQDAFAAAFQNYAVAVYRSYFQRFSGQTLSVTGSREHAPGDDVVMTTLTDPSSKGQALEVDFRVNSTGAKPVINDLAVAGVWLALAQRDDFGGFLSQHKGNVAALTGHLNQVALNYHG